ncbi:MAG: hypothetical protein ISR65_00045 [Bacteriovoracaceae bacterium]|nr:hypothetical protein [Bacteriovoracaceae bacterium]
MKNQLVYILLVIMIGWATPCISAVSCDMVDAGTPQPKLKIEHSDWNDVEVTLSSGGQMSAHKCSIKEIAGETFVITEYLVETVGTKVIDMSWQYEVIWITNEKGGSEVKRGVTVFTRALKEAAKLQVPMKDMTHSILWKTGKNNEILIVVNYKTAPGVVDNYVFKKDIPGFVMQF